MSKFDSFFESPSNKDLNNTILKKVEVELQINKQRELKKKLMMFLVPALSAVMASYFAFKISTREKSLISQTPEADVADIGADDAGQLELISSLMDDTDSLEIADDLSLLENLDELELLDDKDMEG